MQHDYNLRAGNGVRWCSWAMAALALVGPASGASAIPILNFVRIADTSTPVPGGTGTISSFSGVTIENGVVAFRANNGTPQVGLYSGSGGPLSTIANPNTPIPNGSGTFTGFGEVSLDGNDAAFYGSGPLSSRGIYARIGGSYQRVADRTTTIPGTGDTFNNFGLGPVLAGGDVVFAGTSGSVMNGLYRATGGTIETLADGGTAIPGGTGTFTSLNSAPAVDSGRVVFLGNGSSAQRGIYESNPGGLALIADLNTPFPAGSGTFDDLFGPDASSGTTVFWGRRGSTQGVFRHDAGLLSTVVSTSDAIPAGAGNFTSFGTHPGVDGGIIAFSGSGSAGQFGIYVESGGGIEKVIDLNDTLDGKALSGLVFLPQGLAGRALAFEARFADGSVGVYRTIVPEPGAIWLLGAGALMRMRSRGRRTKIAAR